MTSSRVTFVVITAMVLVAVAACGGSSRRSSNTSSGGSSNSGRSSAVSTGGTPSKVPPTTSTAAVVRVTCNSLVGQPVTATATCTFGTVTYAQPGSGDCTPGGKTSGSWYYFTLDDSVVFGRVGGAWKSAPSGTTDAEMRSQIGC